MGAQKPTAEKLRAEKPMTEKPTAKALSTPRRLWMLTVACTALAAVVGSMSALYTSIADIALDTGASQSQITWIVDAYTLSLAALVLSGGAVGDWIGRRLALIVGLAIFTAATAVPLALTQAEWIIAARICAGVGAALIMPSTLSLLTATFPEDKRSRAVGLWAGVAAVGAIFGILTSGFFLQFYSWSSTFILFTVLGGVLLVASMTLPESRGRHLARFDFPGAMLSAAAVGGFVGALIEGPHRGWTDGWVLAGFILTALATAAFIAVELRSSHPLLDIRYFRRPGLAAGSLSVTLQFLVAFGLFLLLVQYLQLVRGYGPLDSALAIAPMVVPMLALSVISPWILSKLGLKIITVVGLLTMSGGLWWFTGLAVDTPYVGILWPMLVVSAGMGLCTAPATFAIISDSPVEEHGVAAAVNDATREIGAAIGIAIAGSTVGGAYSAGVRPKLGLLPEQYRDMVERSLAGALEVAAQAGPAGSALRDGARQAYTDGVSQALLILVIIGCVGAAISLFLAPGRNYEPQGQAKADSGA